MKKMFTLECCVDCLASAKTAKRAKATRLELCSNLVIGGTTPSPNLFRQVQNELDIPIHVLIRPRFGDFLYSKEEFALICEEIATFVELGADGIVCGCLTAEGKLNMNRMKTIKTLCKGVPFTLHRGFDACSDPIKTLKDAEESGVNCILTSGQQNTCLKGQEVIAQLLQEKQNSTEILIGGGVNATVISQILSHLPANSFHMSGKKICDSPMRYRNLNISMGAQGICEFSRYCADEETIKAAYHVLESYFTNTLPM